MKKNLLKLLILLLIQQLSYAQDSYPKKLIIQNSSSKDTIIAQTNKQVEQANKEHVALKACVKYSDIQDSTIQKQNEVITSLQSLNFSLIKQDSLSRRVVFTQDQIISQKESEYKDLQEIFKKYQKQVKRDKIKTWLYSNLVVTPTVVVTTALIIKFTK